MEKHKSNNIFNKILKVILSFKAIKIGFIIIIAIILFSIISGASVSIILKDDTADKAATDEERKEITGWLEDDE